MLESLLAGLIVLAALGYLIWKTVRISQGKEKACSCEMEGQCPAQTGCPSEQGLLEPRPSAKEIEARLAAMRAKKATSTAVRN